MRSFFAMLWNPNDPSAAGAAARVRARLPENPPSPARLFEAPGLVLADLSRDQPAGSILPAGKGKAGSAALFGTLFCSTLIEPGAVRVRDLEEPAATRIAGSEGRTLIGDYWGSYVSFASSGAGVSVITDPTSSIPCYVTCQYGVTFAFSHLERCTFIDTSRFSLNHDFIARLLAYDRIQTGETGLNEVRELLGGQGLFVSQNGERLEQVWDPGRIARSPCRSKPDDAAAELRHTAKAVIASWARQFDRIHVDLSGGFDSSALCGLLAPAPGDRMLVAIHQRLQASDPSESDYARAAAAHAGLTYAEVRLSPDRPVPAVCDHPLSARPQRQFIGMDLSAPLAEAGLPFADAYFTGQGGDHLFLAGKSPLGFCDFLNLEGVNARAGDELLNAAHLSGQSVWSVLATCLPRLLAGPGRCELVEAIEARRSELGLASAGRAADLPEWVREPGGLPPLKFNQVCNLMHMVQVREQFDRAWTGNVVHPYISQPLIELCLRLPAYLLTAGGESRGLARAAFKGLLPETIRRRMSKGTSSSYFMDYLMANHEAVLGELKCGALVGAGLLQSSDLDAFSEKELYRTGHTSRRLLTWYTIEAWLRGWKRYLNEQHQLRYSPS